MPDTKIIRIFEDSQHRLTLSTQNLKDLIGMREIIGENNIIIQADGKLMIRHYVGFVQINKTRLLVYPKIAKSLSHPKAYEESFNMVVKMLAYTGFYGVKNLPNPHQLKRYQNDLLELYIGLFTDQLTKNFQRDMDRGYNNKLENQSFIKGKIDFNQTIKHNSYKHHLHYVRYDDFNENTLLNQVFKTVIQMLIVRTGLKDNKLKLRRLLLWLEDVSSLAISDNIWNRIVFTRQNRQYEPAFNMAKLFYFNASPHIRDGQTSALSFLVPVNRLFEAYLYKLLKRNLRQNYTIQYQGPIDYLAKLDGKNYLQLKPDISLLKDKQVQYVMDAKYKVSQNDEAGKDLLTPGDVYQMLAYSVRYQCNKVYLIYPKLIDEASEGLVREFTIQNYDQEVRVGLIKMDLAEEPDQTAEKLFNILRDTSVFSIF